VNTRKIWIPIVSVIAALGLISLCIASIYFASLPDHVDAMETVVLGQTRLNPGSQAAMRVVVRNVDDQAPLPDAEVTVSLESEEGGAAQVLYNGRTDASGVAEVNFTVPGHAPAGQNLIIVSRSSKGQDRLVQPVTIDRDFKILLSTDKPIYQPGQVIHLRALVLSTFDLVPAGDQELEFVIADGKGNKVFRETVKTSEFGVAATDFQLASEVNTGAYKILAQMGNTSSEKTITVERYVLPKYEISWETDRDYYRPGDNVRGSITAAYFFGKNVEQGAVELTGFTFDFERQDIFTIEGKTDEDGRFEFEFMLPEYIAGTEFEGGAARFYLEAAVTDQTNHTENASHSLPVAQSMIIIEAIPESGQIRQGVENILYILTSYPDGTPAQTSLTLYMNGEEERLGTGQYGLAAYRFSPQSTWLELTIAAEDEAGASAEGYFYFEGDWMEETVLLRPEKAVYEVGQTMNLQILTSTPSGTVYLDIVREGQTVSTRSVEVSGGEGLAAVDLTPDLFGTLELHAYKILSWGGIARDTRLVVVDAPNDLAIDIQADQDEYRPGDTARLDFRVSDPGGQGVRSALGIAIVDESVFALAEQDPGFAKLYFMLEAQLLEPKYDIHGFSVPDLVQQPPDDPTLQRALEGAAQASMASAAGLTNPFTLQLNSHDIKIEEAYARQGAFFTAVSRGLLVVEVLIPLAIAGLMVASVRKQGSLSRSITIFLGFLLLLTLVFFLIPAPDWIGSRPLDRLSYFFDELSYRGQWIALFAALGGFLGFIALVVYSFIRKDKRLGLAQLLTVIYVPFTALLLFSLSQSSGEPGEAVLVVGLIAFALVPLAYLFRSAGFGANLQLGWALAAFLAAPVVLVALAIPLAVMSFGVVGMAAAPDFAPGAFRDGMLVEELAVAEMAPPQPAEAGKAEDEAAPGAGEPPRLRQYFPETMYWEPEAITDENGSISLQVPMADSITTWRLSALASSQAGGLGARTIGIRVFQDFFIDLDLPLALTQNDEISVPVGIFNYLPESQDVRLVLEEEDWFELLDRKEKRITIAGNDIGVEYFRIRAKHFGRQSLQVTAYGSLQSDAILKSVTVYPDGKEITFSTSDRLPGAGVTYPVNYPAVSIAGTQKLLVKIYPGVVSQVVEGLDSILRMPYGCFEQTSSTTYPNVLAMDYMKTTGQTSPEVQFKAEEYINLGYQRLTTFEVPGGGFSLFGSPPADRMLTAYGLQEFSDMSEVHPVDPEFIRRAAEWLLAQQDGDGSWANDQGLVHENTWANLQNDRLPVTAYIVWSLIEAGYLDDARTTAGLDYIRENYQSADDPYVVALVANALIAADLESGEIRDFTGSAIEALAGMARYDGDAAFWESGVATFMGSEGQTGSIETTGLATLALLRADRHPEVANAALSFLIRQKDSFGTWYSTQATVMALKALLESVKVGGESTNAEVTVSLNGGQSKLLSVTPDNFDVVQMVSFDDVSPGVENTVEIKVQGEGELMYQISGAYYIPWDEVAALLDGAPPEPLSIDVQYDRTELEVDDTIQVDVRVTMNKAGRAEWALIDLGIPPGFSVRTEDLTALVNRFQDVPEDYPFPQVERFELTGRQVLVYISGLTSENPLEFSFRLQAKFPITARTPSSSVYDYYNPEVNGEQAPISIVVNE
jgi:hypothetical protein